MTDSKFHLDQIYKEKYTFENFNMKSHKAHKNAKSEDFYRMIRNLGGIAGEL